MRARLFRVRKGTSLRYISKAVGLFCGVALCALPAARVSADSLTLTGANPAGTVDLYGSSLPSGYGTAAQAVDVYAGVLDWTDTTNNSSLYTYCIDVGAIIYVGNPYTFASPVALTSTLPLGFSTQQINAIYNLWTDPNFGGAGNIDGSVSGISQVDAGMFQVAIWDILYNDGSASLTGNTALNFVQNNPLGGQSLTTAELTAALGYANHDYSIASATVAGANPGIDALITTNGQNQAIYIGGSGPFIPAAPLPASFAAGLVLLGLAGVGAAWGLRANRTKVTA